LYDHLSESGALPWTCIWLRKMGSMCLPGCKTRFGQQGRIPRYKHWLSSTSLKDIIKPSEECPQKNSALKDWHTKNLIDALWICSSSLAWFTGLQVIMGLDHKDCILLLSSTIQAPTLNTICFHFLDELHTWTTVVSAWKNWSMYAQTTQFWLGLLDVNTHIISIFHNSIISSIHSFDLQVTHPME
jgi:hypothetical protein